MEHAASRMVTSTLLALFAALLCVKASRADEISGVGSARRAVEAKLVDWADDSASISRWTRVRCGGPLIESETGIGAALEAPLAMVPVLVELTDEERVLLESYLHQSVDDRIEQLRWAIDIQWVLIRAVNRAYETRIAENPLVCEAVALRLERNRVLSEAARKTLGWFAYIERELTISASDDEAPAALP